MTDENKRLEEFRVPTPIKLALLWASLMFLYIYNDYFVMYTPGAIRAMAEGRLGPLGHATPGILVGVALLLAVPAVMIFLSAALPAMWSKWLNVLLGAVYTIVEGLTFNGPELFYKIVVATEIALTLLIVLYAFRWPREKKSADVTPAKAKKGWVER